jgi:hypothetical protein
MTLEGPGWWIAAGSRTDTPVGSESEARGQEQQHDYWDDTADCLDSHSRGRIAHLAPQQELGLLPKRRVWTRCLDFARAGSYGPALEIEVTELLPEKESAS